MKRQFWRVARSVFLKEKKTHFTLSDLNSWKNIKITSQIVDYFYLLFISFHLQLYSYWKTIIPLFCHFHRLFSAVPNNLSYSVFPKGLRVKDFVQWDLTSHDVNYESPNGNWFQGIFICHFVSGSFKILIIFNRKKMFISNTEKKYIITI